MLARVLEPEVMDAADDADDYDAMDHSAVNRAFAADFLSAYAGPGPVLDVGTGTAQIPVELCRLTPMVAVVAVDLADRMIEVAARNVAAAGFADRIRVERANARGLAFPNAAFPAVMSNSIVHHIPDPFDCIAEMVRVTARGGVLFVRDLVRPETDAELARLVGLYAAGSSPRQRQLFADSLRAALTLTEVQSLVGQLGFSPHTVTMTSDRHWTFIGATA